MAVKIIKIKPRQAGIPAAETAKVRAHVDLESFMWEDNSTLNKGTTTRQNMFDWNVGLSCVATAVFLGGFFLFIAELLLHLVDSVGIADHAVVDIVMCTDGTASFLPHFVLWTILLHAAP